LEQPKWGYYEDNIASHAQVSFGVLLGSLPLALVAGSGGGCVHWMPPFFVDLVYHILTNLL
jgi:hypothetical protein